MNYGMCAGGRFPELDTAFEMAPQIGLDGLEVPFNTLDPEQELIFTREGVQHLRRLSEQHGVAMPSCVAGRYNRRGFPDDDPEVREEAVELMLRLIDRCAEAGIERILVAFFGDQAMETETHIERAIDGVGQCAPKAESRGVRLALEGTVDADTWLRIIDGIGSDAVGVYYDVGNAARFRLDGPAEMRLLSQEGLLEQIHIKDMTLEHRNVPLGEGAVDWDAVVVTIRDIGYDEWLVLETPSSDDPLTDYAPWVEFIRTRIEG